MVWVVASVAVPVAIVIASSLGAVDLAYHLRAGDEMLGSRSVMMVDSFTFTAAGTPWLNQQWLSQVLMGSTFRVGGWFGIALLRAVLSAVSLMLVMHACRAAGVDRRGAAWLTLGTAAMLVPSMTMRPQLFGLACFSAALAILFDRHSHPGRLWLLVPLAAAWSNLHGTFPLLFALGGAVLLDDVRTGTSGWRRLLVVGLVSLLATLANPYGSDVWSYVAGLTSNSMIHQAVDEWQSPSLNSFAGTAFLLSIPVVTWLLARDRNRPGWPTMLLLAGFMLLGLMSVRATVWWAMIAAVVLSSRLPRTRQDHDDRPAWWNSAFIAVFISIAMLSLGRWVPFRAAEPVPHHLLAHAPQRITTVLREVASPGERIFASQVWGSWFELVLPDNPVAVDSRIELFPADTWSRYADVSQGREGWGAILDEWNVRVLAVSTLQQPGLLEAAGRSPDWRLVHRDRDGAVLVRQ